MTAITKYASLSGLAAMSGVIIMGLALSGCSSSKKLDPFAGKGSPKYTKSGPLPKGGGKRHVGKPYTVAGRTFYPTARPKPVQTGMASWYGPKFHGRKTSNGEWFDMNYLSAAHPTMPLPSYARVTNLANGRSVVVRVNDRGPFVGTRIMDLSKAAASRLDYMRKGKTRVKVEYLGPAPLGDDRRKLAALNRANGSGADRATLIAAVRGHTPPATMVAQARPARPDIQPAGSADAPGYYVQAASYADPRNARAARERLGRIGPVQVAPVDIGGARYWRVRLGPLASREDAESLLGRLAEEGHADARIVLARN